MKFSLAMSSMPLLRERERTGTNDRGTERNEKTRQREEGGSVRVVGGAVMRVWGRRGRVGARARGFLREARRAGRERAGRPGAIDRGIDRGRSRRIVSSPPTDAPATLVARCLGEGGGRRDRRRGRERTRGARDDAHLAELLLLHEGVHIGIGLLEGLEGLGEDGVLRGAREGGLGGGGFGGGGRRSAATNDVSRDRARAVVTSAVALDRGARDRAGARRSRRARGGEDVREGDDAPWCSSWACGVARCAAGECAAVPIRTRRATPGSGAFRRFQLRKVGKSAPGVRGRGACGEKSETGTTKGKQSE